MEQHLNAVEHASEATLRVLASSTRWELFQAKVRALRLLPPDRAAALNSPTILRELIDDLLTVFRQIADVSSLTADASLDSQNLAQASTRLLPELIEAEDRLCEQLLTDPMVVASPDPFELELVDWAARNKLSLFRQRSASVPAAV